MCAARPVNSSVRVKDETTMKNIRFILILFLISSIPSLVLAEWFGPSDYDECILESMKGVTSDRAAILIERSCRKKFPKEPEKKPKLRDLSYEELSNLTGKAGLSFGSSFSGKIYNGNSNLTISEIAILVKTTVDGKEVSRTYTDEVTVKPLNTAGFGFDIILGDEDTNYSWGIAGAKGY